MIQVLQRGTYKLYQAEKDEQVICFDEDNCYIWRRQNRKNLLIKKAHTHKPIYLLAAGKYRLYNVLDGGYSERHLELVVGGGYWQGFIIRDGLPKEQNHSSQLIPTDRIYTKVIQH